MLLAFLTWCFPLHATNLNDAFGLPVWSDSSLWDDGARSVARRLNLQGAENEEAAFYRGAFGGQARCLGVPLFSVDLYAREGLAQRLVLGFVNAADLAGAGVPSPERAFTERVETDRTEIIRRLSGRLGRAIEGKKQWIWSWMGHQLSLQETSSALVLTIERGEYSPQTSESSKRVEDGHQKFSPASRVKRRDNGDVVITGLPPINQGARGFCVPAAWEKCLRYYGLSLNVYELAEAGGTTASGSTYGRFTGSVGREISPLGFRIDYLRARPSDLSQLAGYLDQGHPIIWFMDAGLLENWVIQTLTRRNALSEVERGPRPNPRPGSYHALLIVGYNEKNKELALSDTTELGHSLPEIWVSTEEADASHMTSAAMISLQPPNSLVAPKREFVRPRWY